LKKIEENCATKIILHNSHGKKTFFSLTTSFLLFLQLFLYFIVIVFIEIEIYLYT